MKTRLRPLSVVFAIVALAMFALIAAGLYSTADEDGEIRWDPIVGATVFALLFLGGVGAIVWYYMVVEVDVVAKSITFTYPLRFQQFRHEFKDVLGFRYRYLNSRIEYKSLKFKTVDGRTFSISDFETPNLRELETIAIGHFDVCAGKEFRKLSGLQRTNEIKRSRQFDITQAENIRTYMAILTLCLLFVSGYALFTWLQNPGGPDKVSVAMFFLMLVTAFLTARRFLQVHRQLQADKKGA